MAGGEEGPSSSGGGDNTNGKYPLGFRFKPTDQEVVEFYLLPKLQDKPTVPNDVIIEDDVYSCDQEMLTRKHIFFFGRILLYRTDAALTIRRREVQGQG
jgi:hypothetical protein